MSTPRTKTVQFYTVRSNGNLSLTDALMERQFHLPFNLNGKTLELKYPERTNDGNIVGCFVMTRTTGIPPKHRINTDDYDALDLGEGEGLSYPNVFLFNPTNGVLALEFNLNGTYSSQIEQFLRQLSLNRNINLEEGIDPFNLNVQIDELLSLDAYQKMLNMERFQKVTMKIAYPTQLLSQELEANGPMEMIGELAGELNATSSMEISFSADLTEGIPGLNRSNVLGMVRKFRDVADILIPKRGRNKLEVEGFTSREDNPELSDKETVDLMKDRMRSFFNLTEPSILTSMQFTERRRGIIDCYNEKSQEINSIIG